MQSLKKTLDVTKMNFEPFNLKSTEAIREFVQQCLEGQRGEWAKLCIISFSKNIGSKKYVYLTMH